MEHLWFLLDSSLFSFSPSGMEVLQYKDASFTMLASVFPECLSPYMEFAERLKIEGKKLT